jgi:hypothetical protein
MRNREITPSVGESAQSEEFDKLVVDHLGDPDGCEQVISSLMDEYVQYVAREHALCTGCPVVRSGPLIVRSMLEWKARRDDRFCRWRRHDIRAFLHDHLPDEVSTDRQLMLDATSGATDLVYFMADRGTLTGDDVHVLVAAADEVFEELTDDSPSYRLPAMVLPRAAELLAMSGRPGRSPTSPTQRRAQRKAARAARKRNRR